MIPLFPNLPKQAPPAISTDRHALLTCALCGGDGRESGPLPASSDGEDEPPCEACAGAGVMLVALPLITTPYDQARETAR